MTEDNFDEAMYLLYNLIHLLYVGYYEPKSDRDRELADELHAIWVKYTTN